MENKTDLTDYLIMTLAVVPAIYCWVLRDFLKDTIKNEQFDDSITSVGRDGKPVYKHKKSKRFTLRPSSLVKKVIKRTLG